MSESAGKKGFLNKGRSLVLGVFCASAGLLTVSIGLAYAGWYLIQSSVYLILILAAIGSGSMLGLLLMRYFIRNKGIRYTAVGIGILLTVWLCFEAFYSWALVALVSYRAHFIYTSPGGKNQLAVIEGGYIDTSVEAYPLHGIFYRYQDNGYLSYRDMFSTGGGKLIQVSWPSEDEAVVSLFHDNWRTNAGSNEDHQIHVSFE